LAELQQYEEREGLGCEFLIAGVGMSLFL